jgi:hypothetical protein
MRGVPNASFRGQTIMNRNEKRILRNAINAVAHHNSNAWWELKRQIFDFGYQSYYPMQGEFDGPAECVIAGQSNAVKESLLKEWRNAKPPRADLSDSEIIATYARLIVEEVVNRARSAAHRTENW